MDSPRDTATQQREWPERQTVHQPVLSAEKARQGKTGQNVRYVLGPGTAGIVIVFLAIYLIYFG
jgi:hypothetical protein